MLTYRPGEKNESKRRKIKTGKREEYRKRRRRRRRKSRDRGGKGKRERVAGREGGGERDCAKIGRLPPSKLVGLEELCELFLPVCPPRIYERSVDALLAAAIQSLGVIEVEGGREIR